MILILVAIGIVVLFLLLGGMAIKNVESEMVLLYEK